MFVGGLGVDPGMPPLVSIASPPSKASSDATP